MANSRRPELCPRCNSPIIAPTRVNHGCHFVLTLCSLGLWSIGWLAAVLHARVLPWRCSTCGHYQAGEGKNAA